jgi:glutamate synthase (NADPH/NADH) small chain
MGNPQGFLKIKRRETDYRPVTERVNDYALVFRSMREREARDQAARCMDCGTPFCHAGCPLGSFIPEWNDLAYGAHWQRALELLQATNCLPEVTGRVCPALCEASCVLSINDAPVTIRENELAIIETAFSLGYIKPIIPSVRTGKKVAIIGSGPAGLSCAVTLNKLGHTVTVFEKADKIGGLLRYGIPDFKLEKSILDRRMALWEKEGIKFVTGVNVGVDYPVEKLRQEFAAVCLAGGASVPRDLNIEGRTLDGIVFAMDYLSQSNRRVAGEVIPQDHLLDVKGKDVVVIGGGDTGADCVGTAHRQKAKSIVQIEVLPKPPRQRSEQCPWPQYPVLLKNTSSHEEGGTRYWSVKSQQFRGEGGKVKSLQCVKLDASGEEIPGSEFTLQADFVVLAIGFLHPLHDSLLKKLEVGYDARGNVSTGEDYKTSVEGVFSAGDMRRGPSLVVWALFEGQQAAKSMDRYLKGKR